MSVLLVTVDCLRSDHVGCYGYDRPTTPAIDKLASEGVALNGISNSPGTRWALQCIHTGASHERFHGIGLPENRGILLATKFQDEGYSTGAFAVNGFLTRDYGYDQGFDEFKDVTYFNSSTTDKTRIFVREYAPNFLLKNLLRPAYRKFIATKNDGAFRQAVVDKDTVDEAIDWISNQSSDWFAWVHLMNAHTPYARRPTHLKAIRGDADIEHVINPDIDHGDTPGDAVMDAYDAGIRSADAQFSRLLEAIDDETTVILTGDHGEEFGKFGGFHHATVFSTMAQVPLILRSQDLEYENTGRVNKYAQHLDIAPTAVLSENIQPRSHWEGEELLSPPKNNRSIYYRLRGNGQMDSWGVRVGEYKLIQREGDQMLMHSSYGEHDKIVNGKYIKNNLKEKLDSHRNWCKNNFIGGGASIDAQNLSDEVKENLQDLGYINK